MYGVTLFGMLAIGFQAESTNHRHLLINSLLAMAFASVLTLITDLDRAAEGSLQVAREPLIALEQRILADIN